MYMNIICDVFPFFLDNQSRFGVFQWSFLCPLYIFILLISENKNWKIFKVTIFKDNNYPEDMIVHINSLVPAASDLSYTLSSTQCVVPWAF